MKIFITTLLLSCIISGLSVSIAIESPGAMVLSPIELQSDITTLRKTLEKYHPGLYWYTSQEEFDHLWNDLNAATDITMTDHQFFKLLLPVVARIKCAHTLFYPSKAIQSKGSRFPLDLTFIDGKAFILSGVTNQYSIPKGSELLSINGRPTKDIIKSLLPNLQAQGGNVGWKYVILENDFQNYYYYLIEHVDSFKIEYLDYSNKNEVSAIIAASQMETLRNYWQNWYPKKDGKPLSLKFLTDPDVVIITIKSLARARYKEYDQKFEKDIDQFFNEINKSGIKNLIMDLRGNEGGSESTRKLYSYLVKRTEVSPEDQNDGPLWIKPSKNSFDGNVMVLTNERSISSLEGFVSIFKYYQRGLTIGGSTPGCYKGLCGGKKHQLILPHSRFELIIPMHQTIYRNSIDARYQEGQGYPPDFKVEIKIEDIINGRDVVMEFALELIKKKAKE